MNEENLDQIDYSKFSLGNDNLEEMSSEQKELIKELENDENDEKKEKEYEDEWVWLDFVKLYTAIIAEFREKYSSNYCLIEIKFENC